MQKNIANLKDLHFSVLTFILYFTMQLMYWVPLPMQLYLFLSILNVLITWKLLIIKRPDVLSALPNPRFQCTWANTAFGLHFQVPCARVHDFSKPCIHSKSRKIVQWVFVKWNIYFCNGTTRNAINIRVHLGKQPKIIIQVSCVGCQTQCIISMQQTYRSKA